MEALDFNTALIQLLEKEGRTVVLNKGDVLLREGEVEKNFYFILSGAVRAFYLSEYEEQIVRFGYEGNIITSLSSFLTEKPSELYLDAIRKTQLKALPKTKLTALIASDTTYLKGYCHLLEQLVTQQIDREIDLLITSPTERLNRVLQRSPNLFQHVPLKYVAAYLRMSPETLSRIRKS